MSVSITTMGVMHHPWRQLREQLPEWTIRMLPLPAGVMAASNSATREIWIDSRARQVERRCSLDHEIVHAEDGDVGPQPASREREVSSISARRLIPFDRLLDVLAWANSPAEAADELWVDLDTFQTRINHLHPSEIERVRARLKSRDNRD